MYLPDNTVVEAHKKRGFTIVELLIVIVVIGILAAITIVSFNGVSKRATISSIQSDLESSAKTLEVSKINAGTDLYPANLSAANLKPSGSNSFAYSYNTTNNTYCLVETNVAISYYILSGLPTAQTGSCVTVDGLVGWWKLNGDATDSSGNGINGTVSGPTITAGQNGASSGAYLFAGGTNAITLPSSNALNLTSTFTVLSWVKLATNIGTSTWNDIFDGGISDLGVGVTVDSSGNGSLLYTQISQADAPTKGSLISKNAWHQLAVSFNTGAISYYLDGNPDGTTNLGMTPISGLKQIGKRVNANSAINGALDDLRVYNRVLSAAEVRSLFTAGAQ